jgi:nucleoside-diphosphate-sugar epimerase
MSRILVAGATGIAGGATARHFASLPGWETVALSRRRPAVPGNVAHAPVDLTDREQCAEVLNTLPGITHLAYMALYEEEDLVQGWRERRQMDMNLGMFRNLLDALETDRHRLQHVTILQGGKAYGSHLHPVPVPAKERWPRGEHDIFYWPQEDLLRERAASADWGFSILRPSMILGDPVGSPMSIVAALGVYASIMKQLGEPLRFPGGGKYVTSCTDSRLIARAVEFVTDNPAARGETFNVVNGDVLVWQDFWPALAAHFGMPVGAPKLMKLSEEMPRLAKAWDEIVQQHSLEPYTMDQLIGGSWHFADHAFAYGQEHPPDRIVMSPIKLRQAGFPACFDTEDSLLHWIRRLQDRRILPAV